MSTHDLTDGQLLAELAEFAMEARDRVEAYVTEADAERDAAAIGRALVFTEKAEDALRPRGDATGGRTVWHLKIKLEDVASSVSLPEDAAFDAFLEEHPELNAAPSSRRRPRPRPAAPALPPRQVNEQALPDALMEAVRKAKEQGRPYATAGEVARVLFKDERVSQSERIRVGQALGRLARDGRAARTRAKEDEAYKWALPAGEEEGSRTAP